MHVRHRIGIEISATAVRMIELALGDGRPKIVAFGEALLPPGALVDGVIVDRPAVLHTIELCTKNANMKSARFGARPEVWLATSGLRALSREILMPAVPDAELDAAVRLQALDIIPFPDEETLLSARSLGSVAGPDGSPLMRVHLAAAHRSLVEPLVDVLSESGLDATGVDLASSALVRSLASPGTPGMEAIVAIGADLTTVVVHEGGEPHFVRTIAGGGNAVTRAIAGALDIPNADAEQMKVRLGWAPTEAGRLPAEAVAAARDGSAPLIADIRSSIEYFATLPDFPEVSRIVLTGGGARLAGLVERLEYQVRMPVVLGSWLGRVEVGRLELEREYVDIVGAVACGAAMPEPAGRKPLDLIPPEIGLERRRVRAARRIEAAAVVVLVGLVGLGGLRFMQVRNAEHGLGSLKGTIAFLEHRLPQYDTVQQQHAAILADSAMSMPLVSHEVNWPAVIAALAQYTPASVSAGGFTGSSTVAPSAVTTAATAGAPSTSSPALPAATDTVGTVNLTLDGKQFPSFKTWFDAMVNSKRFDIVQYSGVTSSGKGISFTAELAITGLLHTDRLAQFEVPTS